MDHLIQHCQSVEKEDNFAKDKNNLAKDTKPGCAWPPECYTLFYLLYLLSHTDCYTQWSDHKVRFHLSNYVIFVSDSHNLQGKYIRTFGQLLNMQSREQSSFYISMHSRALRANKSRFVDDPSFGVNSHPLLKFFSCSCPRFRNLEIV